MVMLIVKGEFHVTCGEGRKRNDVRIIIYRHTYTYPYPYDIDS